jgi:hypothetical protein
MLDARAYPGEVHVSSMVVMLGHDRQRGRARRHDGLQLQLALVMLEPYVLTSRGEIDAPELTVAEDSRERGRRGRRHRRRSFTPALLLHLLLLELVVLAVLAVRWMQRVRLLTGQASAQAVLALEMNHRRHSPRLLLM